MDTSVCLTRGWLGFKSTRTRGMMLALLDNTFRLCVECGDSSYAGYSVQASGIVRFFLPYFDCTLIEYHLGVDSWLALHSRRDSRRQTLDDVVGIVASTGSRSALQNVACAAQRVIARKHVARRRAVVGRRRRFVYRKRSVA